MASSRSTTLGRVIVPLGAGFLALGLAASIWALALRERVNKRLYLEYEVYKALTSLADVARLRKLEPSDTARIVGFGMYTQNGAPIFLFGSAPQAMEALRPSTPVSRFSVGEDSVVLVRAMGGELPGRRMTMGADRGGRLRLAPGQQTPPGASGEARSPEGSDPGLSPAAKGSYQLGLGPGAADQRQPALSFIEVSTEGFRAEERTLLATAIVASLALAGLYALIVAMDARYASAKEREARNRELVELGQAARTIAHEIKNPLGVIRIQCGLLKRSADEATAEGLAIIDEEALRLADLADRIRRYLKPGDAPRVRIAVGEFLSVYAARYAGRVEVDPGGVEGSVLVDESRLVEILDTIVVNALEATELSKTSSPSEPVRLVAAIRKDRLTLSVLDRGGGVAPDDEARLFEPFFTTKDRGSGLGLALARRHAESLGGSLSYARRQGGGAAFTLSLPLA